jgi:glutamate 5-kinase
MRDKISTTRRIVVKVGSALVTNNGAALDPQFIDDCARQLSILRDDGHEVLLVTSGAIAAGMQRLGWTTRPHSVHKLQAAAAVGQLGLAKAYEEGFAKHQQHAAQVLLTHEDLADRVRYLNARSTLRELLSLGVIPIINENDTVITDEIKFGDNDTLGALVANLVEAEVLLILTDQEGLYTADPRKEPSATLVSEGRADDARYEAMAGGAGSGISKGGMLTKVKAARRAARSGAHTIICSGRQTDCIIRAAAGETLGTVLYAEESPLSARKRWLADHLQMSGRLVLDEGAVNALRAGRSLLPIGVQTVEGDFERGATVSCVGPDGETEVARGIVNYPSGEALRIARHASSEIERLLGYVETIELIHRDNLVTV